jgi:hypothetical protein
LDAGVGVAGLDIGGVAGIDTGGREAGLDTGVRAPGWTPAVSWVGHRRVAGLHTRG